jgi:hypothetical protein
MQGDANTRGLGEGLYLCRVPTRSSERCLLKSSPTCSLIVTEMDLLLPHTKLPLLKEV